MNEVGHAARVGIEPETRVEALRVAVEGDDQALWRGWGLPAPRGEQALEEKKGRDLIDSGQVFGSIDAERLAGWSSRGRFMRKTVLFLAILIVTLPGIGAAGIESFPRPADLEPQIRFWRAIFTTYSKHQVLVHDALDLDKIYAVLDFRSEIDRGLSEGEVDRLRRVETEDAVEHLRGTFLRLHALGSQPEGLTAEERRLYDLYRDDPSPTRFLDAADEKRLHTQRGLRERFGEALRISHRYLPEMERIFRQEGLPVELTRLPLIESCFNLHAYSKVGAAGIWQFMPATGRRFMQVGSVIDERRDPIASTRAAAAFLDHLHDGLGSWPLAITAYNHGPDGIARAVDDVGSSDIVKIIHEYHGPAFGFASRNFYAEFLAALDVDQHRQAYFGDLTPERSVPTRIHRLDRPIGMEAAARLARTDRETLAALNPALMPVVVSGRRAIPKGYQLRMPEGVAGFETRLAQLGAEERVIRVAAPETRSVHRARAALLTHRVARGQTLSHIAKRYKVTVGSLRSANRLARHGTLRPGQVLKIPRSA
jgi:membrane-bound lytic murein transglycosylase D